ncbi:hypothetical protein DH09_08155 [Bacillaceae bacterium JMAK1]|nr:hypothetical protein DH09_08155 [Bacillaceae bacterium JMAK1]
MSQNLTVTTLYAREQMAKARAEGEALTTVLQMAFGNGGLDTDGSPMAPTGEEQKLENEIFRKDIDSYELDGVRVKYKCTLEELELAGENINELALVDEEGNFTALRRMGNKFKDGDIEFVFEIDDIY